MARAAGCTHVLIGHSERRQLFGETDSGVGDKVRVALASGLLPIVCVGETLAEREAGRVEEVVHRQLAAALAGLTPDQAATVTLAYEPVWAIGTGMTPSVDDAENVNRTIRSLVTSLYDPQFASGVRILYGGSMKPGNAGAFVASPEIDGGLIGGASLSTDDFVAICRAVAGASQE